MSTPVSINDGPFSSNILLSKKVLLLYFFIIWLSFLPLILEIYLFWKIVENNYMLFILILPIQICISYIIIFFSALLISKFFLIITNVIHKPKEGVFNRKKSDKDYYFWCLRSIIRKWPIWITNLTHISFFNNLLLRVFGVKTKFSNSLSNGKIDCEFIELGKNVSIGKGSFVKSSMIFQDYLIIKKILIADNVIIGSQSYISPGTEIGENTSIGAFSVTKLSQNLEPYSIYSGCPSKKYDKNHINIDSMRLNLESQAYRSESHVQHYKVIPKKRENIDNIEGKFVKKIYLYLIIFFIIYTFAYSLPVLIFISFYISFFQPFILQSSTITGLFIKFESLIIFLITPIIIIGCFLIHLLLLSLITKVFYNYVKHFNPPKEGVYHWNDRDKDYINYFIRSFLIRYIKWKIQRSPFPWLIKSIFNFIGNCHIGKNTVIEDMYIAKEFLTVGDNTYLGKVMIANQLWDNNLTIKGINIKNNVVISDGTCIAPGTNIENNVSIGPLSITAKCDNLNSNSIYFSAPIRKINERDLNELFNLDIKSLIDKKINE